MSFISKMPLFGKISVKRFLGKPMNISPKSFHSTCSHMLSFALCIVMLFGLSACNKSVNNPEFLQLSIRNAEGSAAQRDFWEGKPTRISAMIQPERVGLGKDGLAFQAEYKKYADGGTRFSMFMPHGAKLGQCLKATGDTEADCSSVYIQGTGTLVKATFEAIDEVLNASPLEEDAYSLQYGYQPLGVSDKEMFLVRTRESGKNKLEVLYTPTGDLEYAAFHEGYDRIWHADFSKPDAKEGAIRDYVFKKNYSAWYIRVKILALSKEEKVQDDSEKRFGTIVGAESAGAGGLGLSDTPADIPAAVEGADSSATPAPQNTESTADAKAETSASTEGTSPADAEASSERSSGDATGENTADPVNSVPGVTRLTE